MVKLKDYYLTILFTLFIGFSIITGFQPGLDIFSNFTKFSKTVLQFILTVFILIGIFEVWVQRETIEKHLGEHSKFTAYLWAILLASTSVGGLYVALPVSKTLYDKGARLSVVFTFIGAASVARIPMTLFEASFVGVKFTIIRLLVSIPLIILTSILIEKLHIEKSL